MKNFVKIGIGLIVLAVALFFVFRITGNAVVEPEGYDGLAKCLTDSGAVMYGAYWCPHCQEQKKMFGEDAGLINYVECDAKGENGNPELCQQQGITGYPTWIFGNGERVAGAMSLSELAKRAECEA
jgi:hypothetical protein